LKAHSKGDDDRDLSEIKIYEELDILNKLRIQDPDSIEKINSEINNEIWDFISEVLTDSELELEDYFSSEISNEINLISYSDYVPSENRQIQDLSEAFFKLMEDDKSVFLGEDIVDPYGGAFKVSKGLSTKYPDRVIGTSISEGLIAGVANGLALNGYKPYAEFMFGDFTALAFDQLLNHAAKFYNMYNKKITCPVVFRTPMGGKRGYGPTHSQSIEKHFIGMDMFEIIALNKYLNPSIVYNYVHKRIHPTLIIENKIDYGKKANIILPSGFKIFISDEKIPNILIKPVGNCNITTTIITYGGTSELAIDNIENLLINYDELIQILILTKIDPLPEDFILTNVLNNTRVITVEEGSSRGGVGNNIVSLIAQNKQNITYKVITSLDITIPSVKSLEEKVLVNENMIFNSI
jgi:2-oxoisovalerate dehydrogenase E1 component